MPSIERIPGGSSRISRTYEIFYESLYHDDSALVRVAYSTNSSHPGAVEYFLE